MSPVKLNCPPAFYSICHFITSSSQPAAQLKEIARGGGRDFKSADLARGVEMKEKVNVVKNIDMYILKCLQRFVIAS